MFVNSYFERITEIVLSKQYNIRLGFNFLLEKIEKTALLKSTIEIKVIKEISKNIGTMKAKSKTPL
jgi:hypothetical protein